MITKDTLEEYKRIEERLSLLRAQIRKLEQQKKKIENQLIEFIGDSEEAIVDGYMIIKKERRSFIPDPRKTYDVLGWDAFLKTVKVQVTKLKSLLKGEDLDKIGRYEVKPTVKVIKVN